MRFSVDATLGRLARWLRLLGYDTVLELSADHRRLIETARTENRRIVTRDGQLRRAAGSSAILLRSDDVFDQLRELRALTGIGYPSCDFLRICSRCNGAIEDMVKDDAEGLVPDYIFTAVSVFSRCGNCGRIYWGGSHITRLKDVLKKKALI